MNMLNLKSCLMKLVLMHGANKLIFWDEEMHTAVSYKIFLNCISPTCWPARLGSLGVEAFIDAARAAGPLLTTALAGLVLALTADAVLLAWFCRFEDGRADA